MIRKARMQWLVLSLGMSAFCAGQVLAADVYQGTAEVKDAKGKLVPVKITITLDKTMPEAERLAVVEALKGKPEAAKTVLAGKPQLGVIQANERHVPIRYANVSAIVDGQNITVISDEPLGFIGGAKKSAESKKGFDLTYAMISIKASGAGKGEMGPATKLKIMDSGAPAPARYDNKIVWIENVTKTTKP